MFFEDIKLNSTIEIANAVIDKGKMIAFAKEYDDIPLHTDEEYAKTTRFGKLLAPGVMSFLAVWANYLQVDILGEQLIAGKSTKIEWFKPVFANDTLSATAKVTAKTERNEKNGLIEITISAFNSDGELVLTGVVEAIVKRKPTP